MQEQLFLSRKFLGLSGSFSLSGLHSKSSPQRSLPGPSNLGDPRLTVFKSPDILCHNCSRFTFSCLILLGWKLPAGRDFCLVGHCCVPDAWCSAWHPVRTLRGLSPPNARLTGEPRSRQEVRAGGTPARGPLDEVSAPSPHSSSGEGRQKSLVVSRQGAS